MSKPIHPINVETELMQAVTDGQWVTQAFAARILGVSVSTLNEHITSLRVSGTVNESELTLKSAEGRRLVSRKKKCIGITTLHAIAMKARRYDIANSIRSSFPNDQLVATVVQRPEMDFFSLLQILSGIVDVLPQEKFGRYVVDFYLPQVRLAVEYDERRHRYRIDKDLTRQSEIETKFQIAFERVQEGEEIAGLTRVTTRVFRALKPSESGFPRRPNVMPPIAEALS